MVRSCVITKVCKWIAPAYSVILLARAYVALKESNVYKTKRKRINRYLFSTANVYCISWINWFKIVWSCSRYLVNFTSHNRERLGSIHRQERLRNMHHRVHMCRVHRQEHLQVRVQKPVKLKLRFLENYICSVMKLVAQKRIAVFMHYIVGKYGHNKSMSNLQQFRVILPLCYPFCYTKVTFLCLTKLQQQYVVAQMNFEIRKLVTLETVNVTNHGEKWNCIKILDWFKWLKGTNCLPWE